MPEIRASAAWKIWPVGFPNSRFRNGTAPSAFRGHPVKNMFGVDSAGDELHSISGEHAQEPLPTFVDECDFIEVYDAGASPVCAVVLLPARSELMYPGRGKAAMQNSSLFCGRFAEIDLQHAVFLRVCPQEDSSREWATPAMACSSPNRRDDG
jgi:hypothetical protein